MVVPPASGAPEEEGDDDDVPDMEAFEEENLVEASSAIASGEATVAASTRAYDVALTYDTYYQTPKVWLVGYAATGQPLGTGEMLRDVSADHAGKTVTLAPHPHLGNAGGAWLWIHPCRHAQVMHKFTSRMAAQGRAPRVDQYLLLFLKFLGAVLPTIQYDNTFEIDLAL
jgi:ubiquitin-like-conjugating enzyme ATG3